MLRGTLFTQDQGGYLFRLHLSRKRTALCIERYILLEGLEIQIELTRNEKVDPMTIHSPRPKFSYYMCGATVALKQPESRALGSRNLTTTDGVATRTYLRKCQPRHDALISLIVQKDVAGWRGSRQAAFLPIRAPVIARPVPADVFAIDHQLRRWRSAKTGPPELCIPYLFCYRFHSLSLPSSHSHTPAHT